MSKLLLVTAALFYTQLAAAQDLPKELYMPNEAGGFVVITTDACPNADAVKKGYKFRAYATESSDAVRHDGCWDSPSTAGAPKMEGVRIIALVNLWFNGDTATVPQTMFGPEKKRWDITLPEIEVNPDHKGTI
jgi:hypothetical protein